MSETELYNIDNTEISDKDKSHNTVNAKQKGGINLELGDIIEINAPSNAELNDNTFFITYIDDHEIDLTNVSTFHPYHLKMDDHRHITDESIRVISLLSRSEEPGYARQHLLLPKTWVDIHFGGEVPTITTGEITNLEEDMIEITTYPNLDTIYIDFQYTGLPKDIQLEQIVIRTKPASLEKIESLLYVRDNMEEGEEFEPDRFTAQEASIEYNDVGEAIISLPSDVRPDVSIRDELHNMYSAANEIVYGEEYDEFTQQVELTEKQKRHGIETQVNDMLDELLSEYPSSNRTPAVLDNIHLLIQRFRELREAFSNFDSHGNVKNAKFMRFEHKPLADHIYKLDARLKWILPVVTLKKKVFTHIHPETMNDVVQYTNAEVLGNDELLQSDYIKDRFKGGDVPAYVKYYQTSHPSMTPIDPPQHPDNYLSPNTPVQVAMDTIVNNLENFYSTVLSASKDKEGYVRRQHVIQRFELGQSYLASTISKTGRRVFVREQMTPNDSLTMRSLLVLPPAVAQFSSIDLPGSSILTKSGLSHNYLYLFRLLHKRVDITPKVIREFGKDRDAEYWDHLEKAPHSIHNFLLDEALDQQPERFRDFLQTALPNTKTMVQMLVKMHPAHKLASMLSVKRATDVLEPYLVYTSDLNYTSYNSIRYFIKIQSLEYKQHLDKSRDEMNKLLSAQYSGSVPYQHRMETMLFEKKDLFDMLVEMYNIHVGKESRHKKVGKPDNGLSPGEWMSKIISLDNSRLFSNLIRFLMSSLITPENLIEALDRSTEKDDMSAIAKIKPSDCARRVLSKKYSSMKDLQKDNGEKDVFFDKEYDDTPYQLLKDYKEEEKKYSHEDFIEFLAESLVQKHDCPPKMSDEMATSIIEGKKRVHSGEYAVLEIKPQLPGSTDQETLSKRDRDDVEQEANIRKKIAYYKRVGEQWVHDESVDETAFIDSNTLFCNMSKICFRNTKSNVCESVQDAEKRMREIARKKMVGEFDERFAISTENLQDELKSHVEKSMRAIQATKRLLHVQQYKANNLAFDMGRFASTDDIIRSPRLALRDEILGQDDFVKRQYDLVKFVELFCRNAMVAELGESFYWLYCTETNAPLLPTSLYELARTFVSTENYIHKLNELCRTQGVIEGDSIVDKYSGYVLRKIDVVDEQGFDEAGRPIITSDFMEEDAGDVLVALMASNRARKDRVSENPDTEMIYNIFRAISLNIGLPLDSVEDFVLRTCLEIMKKDIKSEEVYIADGKDKDRRPPPYEIYRNQSVIFIVASVILVSIQTAIPSFKIQKTFPGCVQSFLGFPDNQGSVEDKSGIQYLACVLNVIKSKSVKPWNAIKPLPVEIIQKQMETVIRTSILTRNDLMELYAEKREYRVLHPDEIIPEEHSIQKWVHFLPPVVDFQVVKELRGISADYKNEMVELMRTGNKEQRNQLAMFKTKCAQFGFAVIEEINKIVKSKGLLLRTASNVYFTENACCNDKQTARALDYFEDKNKEITVHVRMVKGWGEIIEIVRNLARASMLYDPKRTGLTFTMEMPADHFEKNVYLAFIQYCNLDTLIPIPEDLRGLFAEKVPEYDPRASLSDKIEFLKKHGKRFNNGNLLQLMDVVNKRNLVNIDTGKLKGSRVSGLRDFLSYMDQRYGDDNEIPICTKFRELLDPVLAKFNPRSMVAEDSEETYRLNNWLTRANTELLDRIVDFLGRNGNLASAKKRKLEEMMANIHMWNMDSSPLSKNDETAMYSTTQFMRNSVFSMSRTFPEMIVNNHNVSTKAHKHWNLANDHNADISRFIGDYYKPLQSFMNDRTITNLTQEVQTQLRDVTNFLELIPTFTPLHKEAMGEQPARTYYSLFTKRTLYMIYSYVWYSVLYEYIRATDNEDLLQMDVQERKQMRRQTIRENQDEFILGLSSETYAGGDDAEYGDDLAEIQIVAGDQRQLKSRVAEMLLAFLEITERNKKAVDLSYGDIEKRVTRSKMKEKKLITDFLRDMDPDERRMEDTKKMLKLGRWNVGLRKGLVNYDKARYDEERKDLLNQLANQTDMDEEDVVIQRNVQEIEADDDAEVDAFYDQEANDIAGYMGDDADGAYYEEDGGDDFGSD
jgi:hypothetical protein